MILLGVLLVFMDVAPAMVLFGIIQMASNGWRATLWWRYVELEHRVALPGRLDDWCSC